MIPLYLDYERQLVDLLTELNVGIQEIFEDFAVQLGENKINSWKAKVSTVKNNLSTYRLEVAAKTKDLKQSSNVTQQSPQPSPSISNNSTMNSSLAQERLNFDRDRQRKQEERLQTEAETRLKAVMEDTKKFGKKFPNMAEDWTFEENIKIETAMKEISSWERQMSSLKKESREVEIIVRGNQLTDADSMVQSMLLLTTNTEKLMDHSIKQVQFLDRATSFVQNLECTTPCLYNISFIQHLICTKLGYTTPHLYKTHFYNTSFVQHLGYTTLGYTTLESTILINVSLPDISLLKLFPLGRLRPTLAVLQNGSI